MTAVYGIGTRAMLNEAHFHFNSSDAKLSAQMQRNLRVEILAGISTERY